MGSLLEIAENHFFELGKTLLNALHEKEELNVSLHFENSTFVRFNKSKVRQGGCVEQSVMSLQFQNKGRSLKYSFGLTGHMSQDVEMGFECLQQARHDLPHVPVDPFLIPFSNGGGESTKEHSKGKLLESELVIPSICETVKDQDFVGFYTSGPLAVGSMNSAGQKHWFSTESFFLDYSLYHAQRAVKSTYAAQNWSQTQFQENFADAARNIEILKRPKIKVPRGRHRVYLAPTAVSDLTGIINWGALSYSQARRGDCGLHKVFHKERSLSPLLNLKENFSLGLSPRFNPRGEVAPTEIELISQGQLKNMLVSTRSSKEFDVASNQASDTETPRSLEIGRGSLAKNQIFDELNTGIYISNLHYLNWSDVLSGRFTGMTRYACFWVENKEVVGPIEDMRFDVSLLDCLGDHLLAVTDFQELFPNVDTYESRHLGGCKVPGLLIDQFNLTL